MKIKFLILLFFVSIKIWGCKCADSDLKKSFEDSEFVFIGEIYDVVSVPSGYKTLDDFLSKVKIEKIYKDNSFAEFYKDKATIFASQLRSCDYIFDRKGDYQSFISRYGIYESAWEIVRGINKTEGHVRTYFESNYKTSRKVVEDLLIEEIIQKSFNNKLSVDNDEGMMAQTLMDIKDKLVELSKKHSQLGAYDSQIAAIDSFKEYLSTY